MEKDISHYLDTLQEKFPSLSRKEITDILRSGFQNLQEAIRMNCLYIQGRLNNTIIGVDEFDGYTRMSRLKFLRKKGFIPPSSDYWYYYEHDNITHSEVRAFNCVEIIEHSLHGGYTVYRFKKTEEQKKLLTKIIKKNEITGEELIFRRDANGRKHYVHPEYGPDRYDKHNANYQRGKRVYSTKCRRERNYTELGPISGNAGSTECNPDSSQELRG